MRRQARRDNNEALIVAHLERNGIAVRRLSQAGVPDLVCSFNERTCHVDAKAKRGKLTDDQVKWLTGWQGKFFIARSEDDAGQVVAWLKEIDA